MLKTALPGRSLFGFREKPELIGDEISLGNASPLKRRWSPTWGLNDLAPGEDHEDIFAALDHLEKGGLINVAVLEKSACTPAASVQDLTRCSLLCKDRHTFTMLSDTAEILLTARHVKEEQVFELFLGAADLAGSLGTSRVQYV